jgi:hypothetical protein
MAGINTGKVLTGGLLAGLLLNVGDFGINYFLGADMAANLTRLHLDPAKMTDFSAAVPWIVIDFLMGLLAIFTYAAMRPRFGPGPKTALIAGGVLFLGVTFILFGFQTIGFFPMDGFVKNTVCEAVNVAIASVVGAWAYKEV